jgi:protein TonB
MSRLALSLVAATLVHGALYAASVAFSPGPSTREEPPAEVDVEVVAAKPDPVAATTLAAEAPTRRPARPPRAHATAAPVHAATTADHGPPEAPIIAPSPTPAPPRTAPVPATNPTARARDDGALLSAKPRYRVNPAPEYPIASRRRREEGTVMLKVTVETNGAPSAISLAISSGYPLLDDAALDAVRHWAFDPARAGGVPVSSLVTVPVRFSLADGP